MIDSQTTSKATMRRRLLICFMSLSIIFLGIGFAADILNRRALRNSENGVVAVCRQGFSRLLENGLGKKDIKSYATLVKKHAPDLRVIMVLHGNRLLHLGGDIKDSPAAQKIFARYYPRLRFGRLATFSAFGARCYWLSVKKMRGQLVSLFLGFERTSLFSGLFLFVGVALLIIVLLLYCFEKTAASFFKMLFFYGLLLFLMATFLLLSVHTTSAVHNISLANQTLDKLKNAQLIFGVSEIKNMAQSFNAGSGVEGVAWCYVATGQANGGQTDTVLRAANESLIAFAGSGMLLLLAMMLLSYLLAASLYKILSSGKGGSIVILQRLGLIVIILFCVAPLIWLLVVSLLPAKEVARFVADLWSGRFFLDWKLTFNNYLTVLDGPFLRYFRNSLLVSFFTAVLAGVVAILPGYAFSRFRFSGRERLWKWFFSFRFFPTVMMVLPFYIAAKMFSITEGLGMLVLFYSVIAVPFAIWMMKRCFDLIPVELEETAAIAGASVVARIWHLLLPLSKKGIAATFFYSFLVGWNEFLFARFFIKDPQLKTLPVAIYEMSVGATVSFPLFAAAAVLSSLPVIYIFWRLYRSLAVGLSSDIAA